MKKSEPGDADRRPAPTEARKDDSALFSVAALMKQGSAVAPQETPRVKDESGIIDLKALALVKRTKPGEPSRDLPGALPHADLFSSGLMNPVVATPPAAATAPPEAASSKKSGVLIVGGVVLAIAAAAGAFAAMRGPKETPPAVASAPPPKPSPEPEKTPPPVVKEPGVEAVVPGQMTHKEPSAKPVLGPGKLVVAKPPATGVTAKPTAAEPPPAEVKPPVDTCDLQCQMQRAVDKKH